LVQTEEKTLGLVKLSKGRIFNPNTTVFKLWVSYKNPENERLAWERFCNGQMSRKHVQGLKIRFVVSEENPGRFLHHINILGPQGGSRQESLRSLEVFLYTEKPWSRNH